MANPSGKGCEYQNGYEPGEHIMGIRIIGM
jgi:hypothetical protein